MAYDNKTRTISLDDPDSDFILDAGTFFVSTMREAAQENSAPLAITKNWKVLEQWLGCAGRDLTAADNERIAAAWRGYVAIGVAPAEELQPLFDSFSKRYKQGTIKPVPPPEAVMDVFDTFLASDEEIARKRAADIESDRKLLEPILRGLPKSQKQKTSGKSQVSWWRRQSIPFRMWTFGALIWAVAVYVYVIIFDPFKVYDNGMGQDEYSKMFLLMAIPVLSGLVKLGYDKFVK